MRAARRDHQGDPAGIKLEDTKELKFAYDRATAKVLSKAKSPPPNNGPPAERMGDTQVEAEITVPADAAQGPLKFIVIGPTGESAEVAVHVEHELPVIAEKEPNNGFRQAQEIKVPQVVDGAIQSNQDVDMYRFEGTAGRRWYSRCSPRTTAPCSIPASSFTMPTSTNWQATMISTIAATHAWNSCCRRRGSIICVLKTRTTRGARFIPIG